MTSKIHYFGPWHIPFKATNVLCSDGKKRTVKLQAEPDTYWTIPGKVSVKGKTVTGFVSSNEGEANLLFHAYQNRKNGHLLP